MPLEYGAGLGIDPGVDVLGNLWEEIHSYKNQLHGMVVGSEEVGVMLPQTDCFNNINFVYSGHAEAVALIEALKA